MQILCFIYFIARFNLFNIGYILINDGIRNLSSKENSKSRDVCNDTY